MAVKDKKFKINRKEKNIRNELLKIDSLIRYNIF